MFIVDIHKQFITQTFKKSHEIYFVIIKIVFFFR